MIEKEIVNEEWVSSAENYNICLGGLGGWYHVNNNNDLIRPKPPVMFGKENPFYGKSHTEETKKRLSEANKGRKHSKETRAKMRTNSPRLSGKDHSMFGKKHKEDSKRKMTEALLERHSTEDGKWNHIKAFKNVKTVKNVKTGNEYVCMKDAAKDADMNYRAFIKLLKSNEIEDYEIQENK